MSLCCFCFGCCYCHDTAPREQVSALKSDSRESASVSSNEIITVVRDLMVWAQANTPNRMAGAIKNSHSREYLQHLFSFRGAAFKERGCEVQAAVLSYVVVLI